MNARARRWGAAVPLTILGVGAALAAWVLGPSQQSAAPRAVAPRGPLPADEKATVELFQRLSPSVVHITTQALRRDLFSLDLMQVPAGSGSGFVWDERGHVVTNYHVIQNADSAQVVLADGSSYDARSVGVAPEKDLAVLKIDAPRAPLKPIPVGSSHDLLVGQKVLAIGNPFGLDQSLTTGIVSALGREIESPARIAIRGVIQTDAAINPGNSGGPLLDSAGRLVGVTTAIYSPSGASAGIGFAIPVDTVNRVVPQLIAHGRMMRPVLGVQTAADRVAERLKLEGVLVVKVSPGSGAEKAGLRSTEVGRRGTIERLGDVIVAIDGKPIKSQDDLLLTLENYKPGDTVNVTLRREGKTIKADVRLQGP
jgi:S1-C subfamily serine protease